MLGRLQPAGQWAEPRRCIPCLLQGRVNNVMDFGCFVELMGFRSKQVGALRSQFSPRNRGTRRLIEPMQCQLELEPSPAVIACACCWGQGVRRGLAVSVGHCMTSKPAQ